MVGADTAGGNVFSSEGHDVSNIDFRGCYALLSVKRLDFAAAASNPPAGTFSSIFSVD